jgi:hypothetical protein
MPESAPAGRSGKVVIVQQSTSARQWVLVSPRFKRVGGRLFLIGRLFPEGDNASWTRETTACIRWRFVVMFMSFESVQAYRTWAAANWARVGGATPSMS